MPIFAVSPQKLFFNSINSGVTGPNLTEIVHSAEKFMLFNLLKSELRDCNPFSNGSARMKISPRKTPIFATLIWLPWQRLLRDRIVIH